MLSAKVMTWFVGETGVVSEGSWVASLDGVSVRLARLQSFSRRLVCADSRGRLTNVDVIDAAAADFDALLTRRFSAGLVCM